MIFNSGQWRTDEECREGYELHRRYGDMTPIFEIYALASQNSPPSSRFTDPDGGGGGFTPAPTVQIISAL